MNCKKCILIFFNVGTLKQNNSVTETNATQLRDSPPVTPEESGSATAGSATTVPITLPISSGVNAVVAGSEGSKETGSASTSVDVTDVSVFFNTGPSPLNNDNNWKSSNTGSVFIEKFK